MSKKCKSKKEHNSEKEMHFELSTLIVWIALWIVNTYSKFQVNIFSNKRDISKCRGFCITQLHSFFRDQTVVLQAEIWS